MAIKNQFPGKSVPSSPNANAKNLPMPIRTAKMRKILEKKRKAVKEKHAIMLDVANATMTQTTRPISKTSSPLNQRMRAQLRNSHLLRKTTVKAIEAIKVTRALAEEVQVVVTEALLSAAAAEVAQEAEGDLGDTMMTSTCSRVNVPEIS